MKHLLLIYFFFLSACSHVDPTVANVDAVQAAITPIENIGMINEKGMTLQKRFNTPKGYERKPADKNSFGFYLRNLPLKEAGSKVKYFNGDEKDNAVYCAVVDMEISNRDLQQCADAIIRLRAEYYYSLQQFDQISFSLTNGFKMDYSKWMEGYRVAVNGNKTSWFKEATASNTYKDFRNYLDFVFTYAGTLSLSKSLHSKNISEIAIGDVFIFGGTPGHAVIVVDVAENKKGEKIFMLAQSYMPAQETQILNNFNDDKLNPWYSANITDHLSTPQWTFYIDQLKTW